MSTNWSAQEGAEPTRWLFTLLLQVWTVMWQWFVWRPWGKLVPETTGMPQQPECLVVMHPGGAILRRGPELSSPHVAVLRRGDLVHVIQDRGRRIQVRASKGRLAGWLSSTTTAGEPIVRRVTLQDGALSASQAAARAGAHLTDCAQPDSSKSQPLRGKAFAEDFEQKWRRLRVNVDDSEEGKPPSMPFSEQGIPISHWRPSLEVPQSSSGGWRNKSRTSLARSRSVEDVGASSSSSQVPRLNAPPRVKFDTEIRCEHRVCSVAPGEDLLDLRAFTAGVQSPRRANGVPALIDVLCRPAEEPPDFSTQRHRLELEVNDVIPQAPPTRRESTETESEWRDAANGLSVGKSFSFVQELGFGAFDESKSDASPSPFTKALQRNDDLSYELTEAEMEAVMHTIDADELQAAAGANLAVPVIEQSIAEVEANSTIVPILSASVEENVDAFAEATTFVLQRTLSEQDANDNHDVGACGDGKSVETRIPNSRLDAPSGGGCKTCADVRQVSATNFSTTSPAQTPVVGTRTQVSTDELIDPVFHDLRHVYDELDVQAIKCPKTTIALSEPFLEMFPDEDQVISKKGEPAVLLVKDRGKKSANKIRSGAPAMVPISFQPPSREPSPTALSSAPKKTKVPESPT